MSWVTVALGGAGALKGHQDALAAKKKQGRYDAFRKEAIRMSPWTKMGDPGAANYGNQSPISGALGGAMQGALIGSAFRPAAAKGMGPQSAVSPNMMQQQYQGAINPAASFNQASPLARSPWETMYT